MLVPKSLEGYYQVSDSGLACCDHADAAGCKETGRAGRDGGPAHCMLFFSYTDAKGLRGMVKKGDNPEERDKDFQNIKNVVSYCINISECRRALVLKYFDDAFDAKACNLTCDNCEKKARYGCTELDVSAHVHTLYNIVASIQESRSKIAFGQLKQVFVGANDKKVRLFNNTVRRS